MKTTTKKITSTLTKFSFAIVFATIASLSGCGGDTADPSPTIPEPVITQKPTNHIEHAYFLDQDNNNGAISGAVTIKLSAEDENEQEKTEALKVYWADEQGDAIGEAWLNTTVSSTYDLVIPENTSIPENSSAFIIYPSNSIGEALSGSLIKFHDFSANSSLSGLGGNEMQKWEYGSDRPKIAITRDTQSNLCIFDNGLVSVINMNNTEHSVSQESSDVLQANQVDDSAFPAYSFLCDEQPIHNNDHITDEIGTWTYSTLNDAMFYGSIVHNTFVKHLGEPPLTEKMRLRVHYGPLELADAFWDGAYANFTDAYPSYYSTASLDIIAHEIAHGVLSRISPLNRFESSISEDGKTLHEAFADIAGVMAKYEFTGSSNHWIHGAESHGPTRKLNQIITEQDAIASILDYDNAGDNFYLRIGMITYPFYLLANEWGLESAYQVFVSASKQCWPVTVTLIEAAQCINNQAVLFGFSEQTVETAFKSVKIKLFEQGVLSHYTAEQFKLRTVFNDNSSSTSNITQWLWDFGDGHTSTEQNPEHTFSEAGTYEVTLTVTDDSESSYSQDSFSRPLNIINEYCPFNTLSTNNNITQVFINNTNLQFNPNQADYTQTTIQVNDDGLLNINISGDTQITEQKITWQIWIDLNDNGIFGDEAQEYVFNNEVPQGLPYQLNTDLDLSALMSDGKAKYMRIVGDNNVVTTPCQSNVGEALDLKVQW